MGDNKNHIYCMPENQLYTYRVQYREIKKV